MMYLLIANLSLCLLIGGYALFLRNLTFFQWNRVYLLTSLALSYLLPLLYFFDLNYFREISNNLVAVQFQGSEMIYLEEVVIGGATSTSKLDVLTIVYVIGCIVVLLLWGFRIFKIIQLSRMPEMSKGSFSFFNYVFVKPDSNHYDEIQKHEFVHVRQKHSYDLLFLELIRVFNWFNPVFIYLRRELKFQHECIADQICGESDKSNYARLLLAQAMDVPVSILTHEFANVSLLKKRINMLFKNRSKKRSKLLYTVIIPCLAFVVTMTLATHPTISKQLDEENLIDMLMPASTTQSELFTQVSDTTEEDVVFFETEILAEPEGGIDAFRKWIGQNYVYPEEAISNRVHGRAEVSFIVEKDGSLSDFKIVRNLGYGVGEELVRILQKSEKWKPAIQNGVPVRLAYTFPLELRTNGERAKSKEISPVTVMGYDFKAEESAAKKDENREPRITLKGRSSSDIDQAPEPIEGMAKFRLWVGQNYVYPQEAIDAGVKGTIQISFDVEEDGTLTNFKILKDLSYGTGEAAIDVLRKSGKWKAATKDGKAVKTSFTLPITINLE